MRQAGGLDVVVCEEPLDSRLRGNDMGYFFSGANNFTTLS